MVYLDDILVMSSSPEQARAHRDILLALLQEFGLAVNFKKSELTPAQQRQYLGVVVDSTTMRMTLPPKRLKAIVHMCTALANRAEHGRLIDVKTLRKIVGSLQATSDCVRECRLHLNAILEALRKAENVAGRNAPLSELAVQDLRWWSSQLPTLPGRPVHAPLPDHVFDTDASHHGWGAVFFPTRGPRMSIECQGFFSEEMTSNQRELTAISHGLRSLAARLNWRHCAVRVRTDNQTAMSYVNRMGGRTPELSRIAESLHNYCLERNIFLTAEYLPGEDNTIADRLSRIQNDLSNAKLNPTMFDRADRRWGRHTLDGFASMTNAQTVRYVSYRADPGCLYTDFLSRPIPRDENVWCYPPFSLIARLLTKVINERATITIALPAWPAQPWWPVAMSLITDWPLLLPRNPDLLLTQNEHQQHVSVSPSWESIVLRISGNASEREAITTTLSRICSPPSKEAKMARLSQAMRAYGVNTPTEQPSSDLIHSLCSPLMWRTS